jgi:tetratricopeptide (TPR) repeat protein
MELQETVFPIADEAGNLVDVKKEKVVSIINGKLSEAELKDIFIRISEINKNGITGFSLLQYFELKDGVLTTKEGNTVSLAMIKGDRTIPLRFKDFDEKFVPLDPLPVSLSYIQAFSDKLIGIEKPEVLFYDLSNSEKKILVDARSEKTEKKTRQIREQEEQNYRSIVSEADELFKKEDYEGAKARYNEAIKIKPADEHNKKRIEEIDTLIASNKEAEKYMAVVAEADKLFDGKEYDKAKKQYHKALEMDGAAKHPKERIAEIDYRIIIDKADELFNASNYDPARLEYEKAIQLRSSDKYAKSQLAAIDKISSDLDAQEKEEQRKKAEQGRKSGINPKFIQHKKEFIRTQEFFEELGGKQHTHDKYHLFYVPDENHDEDNPREPILLIKQSDKPGEEWWQEIEEGETADKTETILAYQFMESGVEKVLILDLKKDHSVITNVKK